MAGHVWATSHRQEPDLCLTNPAWGLETNTCSASKLLIIPMQVAPNSTQHAYIRGIGNGTSASQTLCQAMSITANNSQFKARLLRGTNQPMEVTWDLGTFLVP